MHSTFRSVEMHSKWRYKICTCSVILGELEAFQNYKGFSVIFPKTLDAIERFKVMLQGRFATTILAHDSVSMLIGTML